MNVMLDLETFGLGATGAIVQIGAVEFSLDPPGARPPETGRCFERNVALQSSLLAGMTVDESTIAWWRTQSDEARGAIVAGCPTSLAEALAGFSTWYPSGAVLWSHGLAFDVPILEHAYRLFRREPPWSYRNLRDTRTLFHLADRCGWIKPERVTAHTALADALAQARDVMGAWAAVEERR